ncbi:thioesterase family protein [Gordonia sp. ABSL1-1]|uniref:thioesterase family protein n=1 Tax=Gordonia sp. ABSL1-1 TaxID=3053923 RepID=UPI0025735549|nr:thioesterase family protein [Gordonia sp. ABSL1-1]MDL9938831.1 thioesterase family protein [Gordonia sp. ABSL1-1]
MAYFKRVDGRSFLPTEHVSGAWDINTQHIAPALGLLAHVVESDFHDRRPDDTLLLGRLSFDILGTLPMDVFDIEVAVVRPGRTIELVEATLSHAGRAGVRLRAWFIQATDTPVGAGSGWAPLPAPETMPGWDATTMWPGGFIASVQVHRDHEQPGRARFWVRTDEAILDDEEISPLARAAGLFDIANGMAVRVHPQDANFPNIDLTAHLFRHPDGDGVGFDTTVSFGPQGIGVTASVLHDATGPFGTLAQSLTIRA